MVTRRDNTFYPNGTARLANDAALTITPLHRRIVLLNSTSGAKAATLTAMKDGQEIDDIILVARAGGSYTIACSNPAGTPGTVTLDAAGEGVRGLYKKDGVVYYNELVGTATFA